MKERFGNSTYSEAMETHLSQKVNNGAIAGNHTKRKVLGLENNMLHCKSEV